MPAWFKTPATLYMLSMVLGVGLPPVAAQELLPLPNTAKAVEASGFSGVVVVYDEPKGTWYASRAGAIDEAHIPASTFKVLSTLIVLETGVLSGPDSIIPWDDVEHDRIELNQDLSLRSAYQVSALPHYQQLVRQVGPALMQHWIDQVGYGNRDTRGGDDAFWVRGELRISPREQIQLLQRLRDGSLPFRAEVQAMGRDIMIMERDGDRILRAKTGWAIPTPTDHTGWWVGWLERPEGDVFFATVLTTDAPGETFGDARIALTRTGLQEVGALP